MMYEAMFACNESTIFRSLFTGAFLRSALYSEEKMQNHRMIQNYRGCVL